MTKAGRGASASFTGPTRNIYDAGRNDMDKDDKAKFEKEMELSQQSERVASAVYWRLTAAASNIAFAAGIALLIFTLGRIYASREDACSC